MNIDNIHAKVHAKQYFIYDHALTEAFKDGISVGDIRYVLLNGEIIEDYSERQRCLVYDNLPDGTPVHVIVEYARPELEIVTTYVPDKREWIDFKIRKTRSRR